MERPIGEVVEKTKEAAAHMLKGGAMAGATGATVGAVLATLRNESVAFYSSSMGANFFLLSSTYIAFEEVFAEKTGKKDWTVGASAGALTGGFYAGIMGGRVRGLQGLAAGAAVGAAVVLGRQEFRKWRLAKAVERYEDKFGAAPEVFYPDSEQLVESKGPVRPLEFPSLLPKTAKVSEDEIERRILARMDELRKEAAAANEQQPAGK